ncbi:MAG TPA: glycogen debranching N-terminal domain-containing protein [Ilumatobacteraceae bacterium]|nr:glycogen debranching N-terminal domain-containing protein [Ilumatobacteraceae bacterium]
MTSPLDASAESVPVVGAPGEITLVDGRTFAISDHAGNCLGGTHGVVHDDLRHVSKLRVWIDDGELHTLASTAPTPLSSVSVQRLHTPGSDVPSTCILVRRRWIASGLRDEVELIETGRTNRRVHVLMSIAADFAHLFDVKASRGGDDGPIRPVDDHWMLEPAADVVTAKSILRCEPEPDEVDIANNTFGWWFDVPAHDRRRLTLTVEPIVDGVRAGLPFPIGTTPADAVPLRLLEAWHAAAPTLESNDPRLVVAFNQALADLAALRIVDRAHPDRVVVAAGAPWFMTLFGRDSLLTSWMTLPFDAMLARGVLLALAELQGRDEIPASEEQPGKILHELRRRGGGGPFAERNRYYGTVDATPLFIGLAAEAWRWGALGPSDLTELAPAITAALDWMIDRGDSDGDGFIDYQSHSASGLSNQGWKDSWDGVTFADGSFPKPPIGLVEVQGYAYAALMGASELADVVPLGHDAAELARLAARLREHFNDVMWDRRGWFLLGVDGAGRPIDSLTTNPGHALWSGIADPELADRYLDRLGEPAMWSGWGVRTLGASMGAYDPLSYHNGSVWPHDTAICAAGAARYGRWDVVDRIVDGALAAATHFGGRPPELFAGISRDEVPVPVAYPASCSPQAWSSASVLLLVRAMLGLEATPTGVELTRTEFGALPTIKVSGLRSRSGRFDVDVTDAVASVVERTA